MEWITDHIAEALIAVLSFFGVRIYQRTDRLEDKVRETMSRAEIMAIMRQMDETRDRARHENAEHREQVVRELSRINIAIASLNSELRGRGVLNGPKGGGYE